MAARFTLWFRLGVTLLGCALLVLSGPQARADQARLAELLRSEALFEILQHEAATYGETLAEDVMGQTADPSWLAQVAEIHAPNRLVPAFEAVLFRELPKQYVAPVEAFFEAPLGQRLITLELTAREALLDPALEEAAEAELDAAEMAGDPRLELIREIIEVSDTVEANVLGGLNANLVFYRAMVAGGAYPYDISEEEMVADVLAQEPEIRAEVSRWIESYLLLAYRPLTDAELQSWIAFARSESGQAFVRAQFAAFDHVFEQSSAALGAALALRLSGQDL